MDHEHDENCEHEHGEYEDPVSEDPEERRHFAETICAFDDYGAMLNQEIDRRERHLMKLSNEHKARLPYESQAKLIELRKAAIVNQKFIRMFNKGNYYCDRFDCFIGFGDGKGVGRSKPHHLSKVKSTLHQIVRDWSIEGKQERDESYLPIVRELLDKLPVTKENRNSQRVLVPGAGLGRLVFDIAAAGYASQGNEFSYFMLIASNFLLNRMPPVGSGLYFPWIDNPSNNFRVEDMLRPVNFPDVVPAEVLAGEINPDFSMCAGEFIEVYKDQLEEWDAIATCFFIDTAPNVMEYFDVIYNILRPGGVWVNLGPLLFHWQTPDSPDADERYEQSVELAFDEVKSILLTYGFEFLKEERATSKYTCNQRSLMHLQYNTILFTVRKPFDCAKRGEKPPLLKGKTIGEIIPLPDVGEEIKKAKKIYDTANRERSL